NDFPHPAAEIWFSGLSSAASVQCALPIVDCDMSVLPPIQAVRRSNPDRSIPACLHQESVISGKALLSRNPRSRVLPKAVQAICCRDPNTSFAVLENTPHVLARESVGDGERICPALMQAKQTLEASNPQAAIMAAKDTIRPNGPGCAWQRIFL